MASAKWRRPDIDILRLVVNWLILVLHVAIVYSPYLLFVHKDLDLDGNKPSFWQEGIFKMVMWLDGWTMPLFFFVSGVSAYFALNVRTKNEFLQERIHRLIAPSLFLMLAQIPLMISIGFSPVSPACQLYFEGKKTTNSTGECLMIFNPKLFSGELDGEEKMKWLKSVNTKNGYPYDIQIPNPSTAWFCIYLFAYTQILAGLFASFHPKHGRHSKKLVELTVGLLNHPLRLALLPGVWITIGEIALRQTFPKGQYWLFSFLFDWANNLNYISIYVLGFALTSADGYGLGNLLDQQKWTYFIMGTILLLLKEGLLKTRDYNPWIALPVDRSLLPFISRCTLGSFGEWLTILGVYSIFRSSFQNIPPIPVVLREMAMPFYLTHFIIQLTIMSFTMEYIRSFPVNILIITLVTAAISNLITKSGRLRYYFGLPSTGRNAGKAGFTSIISMTIGLVVLYVCINMTQE